MRVVNIIALGQAGFDVTGCDCRVVIDPYLTDSVRAKFDAHADLFVRLKPPPVAPHTMGDMNIVLVTHAHDDHCDVATLLPILQQSNTPAIVGPEPVTAKLTAAGAQADRVATVLAGSVYEISPHCRFWPIAAAHYDFGTDTTGRPAYYGYVINVCDVVIYHSGDTLFYPGLDGVVKACCGRVDVALLAVNGRDAGRDEMGIVGNMEPDEAARLARALGARVVVPMHNDLFTVNRRDDRTVMSKWRDHGAEIPLEFVRPGEALSVPCRCGGSAR